MGTSTDAILFYGYCWDEEADWPWMIGCEDEDDHPDEDWMDRYVRVKGLIVDDRTDWSKMRELALASGCSWFSSSVEVRVRTPSGRLHASSRRQRRHTSRGPVPSESEGVRPATRAASAPSPTTAPQRATVARNPRRVSCFIGSSPPAPTAPAP